MRVRMLFFGVLREMVGKSTDLIDLPEGASVRDAIARYESQIPRLKESLSSLALAVNQQYTGADTPLSENDEVALLPPVSGGTPGAAGETSAGQPAGRRRYSLIVRETIDTPRTVAALKRGETALLSFLKESCAIRPGDAKPFISTMKRMKKWR